MVTRNVVLTEQMSQFIDGLVAAGRYQNASEAMRAGLHMLEREEAEFAPLRERLHAGLGTGALSTVCGRDTRRSYWPRFCKS